MIEAVEEFFSKNSLRSFIWKTPGFRADIYKQQIRRCFYRGSTSAQRKYFLLSHFSFLENSHSEDCIRKFYTKSFSPIEFVESENCLSFSIKYEKFVEREGLLLLLVEINGITLYKIYFWFMEDNFLPTLCIGAFQGGKNNLDINRVFTKEFWGLRPQNMAISALRWYAQALGIKQIYTFPKDKFWNKKIVDQTGLDEFWLEQGATPVAKTPFVRLDMDIPHKDISDVPTRKRSMYKKRYDFLDRLRNSLFEQLKPFVKN